MSTQTAPLGTVSRAIALMEVLRSQPLPMRLHELSYRTGLAKSTVHRLLAELAAAGMVERCAGHYRLARTAPRAAIPVDQAVELRRRIAPHLGELYARTRQTVGLAVLAGPHVVFLERIHGDHGIWTQADETGRAAAHGTAAGKVLMAHDRDAAAEIASRCVLSATTPRTIVSRRALEAELDKVRRQRFAVNAGESAPDVLCVAVPVLTADGRPKAALTLSGDSAVLDVAHALRTLTVASAAVNGDLYRAGAASVPGPRRAGNAAASVTAAPRPGPGPKLVPLSV